MARRDFLDFVPSILRNAPQLSRQQLAAELDCPLRDLRVADPTFPVQFPSVLARCSAIILSVADVKVQRIICGLSVYGDFPISRDFTHPPRSPEIFADFRCDGCTKGSLLTFVASVCFVFVTSRKTFLSTSVWRRRR